MYCCPKRTKLFERVKHKLTGQKVGEIVKIRGWYAKGLALLFHVEHFKRFDTAPAHYKQTVFLVIVPRGTLKI